jgi:tRNA (cytidine/uridine-2'-O-)-methyltransferase
MFNIVLVHPQIPQNTGAIGRLCVNTNARLHIIKPTVYELSDKMIKRAGLDYWRLLDLVVWESLEEFLGANEAHRGRFFFATTKSRKPYFEAEYRDGDYLFFGSESHGLPAELMQTNWQNAVQIPMGSNGRSLNQAIAAGVILYEAIRQNFEEFEWKS